MIKPENPSKFRKIPKIYPKNPKKLTPSSARCLGGGPGFAGQGDFRLVPLIYPWDMSVFFIANA